MLKCVPVYTPTFLCLFLDFPTQKKSVLKRQRTSANFNKPNNFNKLHYIILGTKEMRVGLTNKKKN